MTKALRYLFCIPLGWIISLLFAMVPIFIFSLIVERFNFDWTISVFTFLAMIFAGYSYTYISSLIIPSVNKYKASIALSAVFVTFIALSNIFDKDTVFSAHFGSLAIALGAVFAIMQIKMSNKINFVDRLMIMVMPLRITGFILHMIIGILLLGSVIELLHRFLGFLSYVLWIFVFPIFSPAILFLPWFCSWASGDPVSTYVLSLWLAWIVNSLLLLVLAFIRTRSGYDSYYIV